MYSLQALHLPLLNSNNFLSINQSLLSDMLHIQRVPLNENATKQRRSRKTAYDQPHRLQTIRIRLNELRPLRQILRHDLDDLHQARCILRILIGLTLQERISEKVDLHLILENDSPDCNSDGLPECAEEGEECHSMCHVFVCARGLDAELHGGEEDTGSEAGHEVEEYPGWDGRVGVQQDHETAAERRDHPPGPYGPAVPTRSGNDDTGDYGRGSDSETLWEGGDACDDRGVALDRFVVQRDIIDDRPQHHPVDNGVQVSNPRSPVAEDTNRHQGFHRHKVLIKPKSHYPCEPENQRNEGMPAAPGKHHTAPRDGNNSRRRRRQE